MRKNLEEIQDQIAICVKREIKVQKRNKSPNRKGKQKSKQKKGNKSPSRKGEIKVKKKIWKVNER